MTTIKKNIPMCPKPDDDLLCEAAEKIYGTAFSAIKALAAVDLEWDISKIAQVVDEIECILEKANIPVCRPWEDEDCNICYTLSERCQYCTRT